jgi:hypothetical protein
MAILDVYFTEKHYKENTSFDIVKDISKKYNLKDIYEIEFLLKNRLNLPEVKEDIYYFLPLRMLNIFPTVALFSYIDLKTGKLQRKPFFVQTSIKGKTNNGGIVFQNGLILEKDGTLLFGKRRVKINKFIVVGYDNSGKLRKAVQSVSDSSYIYIVWLRSYGKVLILDKNMFFSSFVQMFVLENIDKSLFEPILLTPTVKILRLKK